MPLDTPSDSLYALLGHSPADTEFTQFIARLASLDTQPEISKISNYTYHAYKQQGVSFCFVPGSQELKLDAIDIYNGETRDGFQQYRYDELPCGLTNTIQAHEIVSMLGEPDRKGGGGQTRMPCWIEYKFNQDERDSGILIQLHGFEWEDREMGWTSFILY
ncbi:hypothetical protein K501DRAFT_285578, partial [Backusella circina FSU 941]